MRAGGLAVMIAGLAGVTWFALELMPQVLGFEDTDNPAVSLDYLGRHPQYYAFAGISLFIMAMALVVASFAVSDALAPRTSSLTRRVLSALGLFTAAFFFMHGVLRESAGPILYLDGLNRGWGESAYLSIQMVGIHGFAQAGIMMFCAWAVGICAAGARSRTLPLWLCILGVFPALRVLMLLAGPIMVAPTNGSETGTDALTEFLWLGSIALIPLAMLWWLCLGAVLLAGPRTKGSAR